MDKAEERAFERCPKSDYAINEMRNERKRAIFIEGYHQAEKDLELTWEDVKNICVQSVLVEIDLGGKVSDERHYTEVLKRFKGTRKVD